MKSHIGRYGQACRHGGSFNKGQRDGRQPGVGGDIHTVKENQGAESVVHELNGKGPGHQMVFQE